MNTIDILLATYNGEKYLTQQLDSIVSQRFTQWRIIARDDCSSDNTRQLLNEYQQKFPAQFQILDDELGNVGILQNFSLLMQHSTAPYIMFCDQDDIWLPEKIELSLNAIKDAECDNSEIPLLVHSDLKVVDEQLNILAESFWHYQNLNPKLDSLNRLLVQNTVTGCTVMINRKLLTLAKEIPQQAIMHDWWLGLIAATFGKIIIVNLPTVLYRQHSNNDTGAKQWTLGYIFKKALTFFSSDAIALTQKQAASFKEKFVTQLSAQQIQMIDDFVNLNHKNIFEKRRVLYRYRLLKQGIVRNVALFLRV